MSATPDLVPGTYVDAYRILRTISEEARAAVLAAMGLAPGEAPPIDESVAVVRRGSGVPVPGEIVLEDGTSLGRIGVMPRDAPFGYHRLERDDGRRQLLITGPGRCHLPPGLREWGWTIQLAATRSRRSWGIGDLDDLRELSRWSASVGAGFVAVGPLNAPNPGPQPEASPYYPSTRRFGNPLHLAVEALPGGGELADGADLAARGRALSGARLIDRPRVLDLKLQALARLWSGRAFDQSAFEVWRAEQGPSLERWAVFCVLSERFGPGWQRWPAEYHDPDGVAVAAEARGAQERVAFHAWLQWCFDRQLAAASTDQRRIADMPVGVDPGGFDAWDWHPQLAVGATIGVPPDRFNTVGQDWGMPPFVPHRLRQAGYRPFIETVRAQLRHAGGLRLDHVLGLFRLWWVPAGAHPTLGAYVSQRTDELLEIVALESVRAGAVVIGEDLGTVPAGVRAELRRRRLLSTRLAQFERRPPAGYPRQAFAAVTTHDLPTLAGLWSGADLADQAATGVPADPGSMGRLRTRLTKAAGLPPGATLARVVPALHRRLAASPAMLVAATLEDALLVEERPNIPGTIPPQRPNWSISLPVPIEDLPDDPRVRSLLAAMRR